MRRTLWERTEPAFAVNRMVWEGRLVAPVAFTRDHLDAGAMAHPTILTEHQRNGSDMIADERIRLPLVQDTRLVVTRYADAGCPEALDEAVRKGSHRVPLGTA